MDASLIDRLADARVLVVGDVLLDRFVEGRVTRISREAPVPVMKHVSSRAMMGGACNVAANVLATDGTVSLVGVCGKDDEARELKALFAGFPRLTARLVVDPARPTSLKTRYVSGWQQLFCVDREDASPVPAAIRDELVSAAIAAVTAADVVVISDYGRGGLDASSIAAIIAAARAAGKPIVVDPRHADATLFTGATLITPNIEEMEAISGIRATDDESAVAACREMLGAAGIDAVLLTRGAAGMTLVTRNGPPLHVPAETHSIFDVTGAGDTVVATVASALAVGAALPDAVRLANTAAGIVVAKPGTATALPHELRLAFGAASRGVVTERPAAAEHVSLWKSLGLKVGFTNGVFDLLHRGHLYSLEQARRRVDRLVVGINSDASVRRLKGAGRPAHDQDGRAAVLAALRPVDLVVVFEEDTPEELIRALKPDVIFKGADYAGQEIPGAAFVKAHGGTVELLPLLEGHSTTDTVARLREGTT